MTLCPSCHEKCCLFSNSQQDFSSCLLTTDLIVFDRTVWVFNRLWLIELGHLIYTRYSTEFGMLFFITNSKHKLSCKVSALFLDLLKKDRFKWFFMENVCKSITSLMVILLSISMLLLSALCVIGLDFLTTA